MSKFQLPPFEFPNEPANVTSEERKEYEGLIAMLEGKKFETESARAAFMEFAPEYIRFKELHEKFSELVAFKLYVTHLTLSN